MAVLVGVVEAAADGLVVSSIAGMGEAGVRRVGVGEGRELAG